MPFSNRSRIVDFDADSAVDFLKKEVDGTLYSVVEYDKNTFNILYIDDSTLSFYDDKDHMLNHFEKVHSYVYLDFSQLDLTETVFTEGSSVDYMTTAMDYIKIVRIYCGREGLFVGVDPGEQVVPLVDGVLDSV